GFHLSDAAEFERWLDGERARLGQRYTAALESLAEASEGRDEFAVAVGWWRRLAAHDPYSGRVALRLMRSLEAAGDRAGALQHARVHAALLREEFDAGPDPEVTAFAERLRLDPPARSAPEPAAVRPARSPPHRDPTPAASGGAPTARKGPARGYAAAAAALLLVLAIVGVYGIRGAPLAAPPPFARSVGVLPFVNMSPDPENAYFSDGLSEEIIAALSRIGGLRVAARTSSFALRDRRLDARAIGDTLGVAAVLEGSVRKDGNRLRVTAQLIDAATGYHIWSDEYNRELEDIFAVQEQIASAIAGALELRLTGGAVTQARRLPDLQAYDLYLRGLYLRNSLTADGLRQAMDFFDRAIELEPRFALAYAAKASVVAPQIYFRHVPWEEGVSELRAAVARALELDSTLGEAHASLGILRLFFDWDWEGAERALRRAIELNPNDPHAFHHLANYLHAVGRIEEAVAARERSVELDPLNARTRFVLGVDYSLAGDLHHAIAEYRRAQQLDPVHPLALGLGPSLPAGPARVYVWQGRYDEAVEEYIRIAMLRGATASELDAIRRAYAASGMPGFWRKWLEMDLRQSGNTPDPLRIATLWALIGDTAQTFHWLDRAYGERNPGLIYLRLEPALDSLSSHPRVARILSKMKFPAR
ncbi:MAG TPA: tetratricopeptide repeat protein, partial [Gemmatimonadales bacterium]